MTRNHTPQVSSKPSLQSGDVGSLVAATKRPPQSTAKNLARGASGVLLINIAGTGLNVMLQVALARALGASEFGVYAYTLTWLNVLAIVGLMGVDQAALRFVAAHRAKDESSHLRAFLRFARHRVTAWLIAANGVFLIVCLLLPQKFGKEPSKIFVAGSTLLIVNIFAALTGSLLQAFGRVVASQFCQSLIRIVAIFVFIYLLPRWTSITITSVNSVIANMAGALLGLVAIWMLLKRELSDVAQGDVDDSGHRAEWAGVSRSLFLIAGCQLLLGQADILIVGMLKNSAETGVYAAGSRIATLITFGITAVNSVLAPTIAALYAKNHKAELQKTLTFAARGVLAYTVPVVLGLIVFGKPVLRLFGHEFGAAYPVLLILAIGQVVIAACGSVGYLMTMTGHQRQALQVIAASAITTIVLNLCLIPRFGLIGAAIATVIATAGRSLVLTFMVWRNLRLNASALPLFKANHVS
jgi:O-antigen/teichoic acid export membrane protein